MKDRWRNRRKMAWWSLTASLLFPLLSLVPTTAATLTQLAIPFYAFTTSVVLAYIGFATVDHKWQGTGEHTPAPEFPRA